MERLDLKNFHFKCLLCGNCCYNVLHKVETTEYAYDYQGNLTQNPELSVAIPYTELPTLKRNIHLQYNLDLRVHPQEAFFMKDFRVGFIYMYQMGVKKKKFCMFYDIHQRKCKIYSARPSACRSYPLIFNPDNISLPTIEWACTGIENEIRRQFPAMKDGQVFEIDNIELASSFLDEFLLFILNNEFMLSLAHLIVSNLEFLFLDKEITPEKINNYELKDFSQFFTWAQLHIKNQKIRILLNEVRRSYDQLQLETYNKRKLWESNPNNIQIQIKIW